MVLMTWGILFTYVFLTLSCFVTYFLVMLNQLSVFCTSMREKTLTNVSVSYIIQRLYFITLIHVYNLFIESK